MSQTFAASNSSIFFIGYFQDLVFGENYKEADGFNSQVEFAVTDTQCEIRLLGGQSYTWYIDGVSQGSFTSQTPNSTWQWNTLFTGLSAVRRQIKIVGGYYSADTMIRLTDTGTLSKPDNYETYLTIDSGGLLDTYARFDGSPSRDATSTTYPTVLLYLRGDSGIRFSAKTSAVHVWASNNTTGGTYTLLQDGVAVATATQSGSPTWALFTLSTTLDSSTEHVYEVVVSSLQGGGYMYGVLLGPGTGLVHTQPAARPTMAIAADSIGSYIVSGMTTSLTGDCRIACNPTGFASNRGGATGGWQTSDVLSHTSQITGLSPKPSLVMLAIGVNDDLNAVSTSTVTSNITSILNAYNSGLTAGTPIIVRSTLPNTAADRATYNAAILAGVNAYNGGTPACPAEYIPTDNWVIPNTADMQDATLHPSTQGYAKIGNREIPIFASKKGGTAFTTSGTSGSVTVTLAGGATFTGEATSGGEITLSASAGTITATAASGTITNNGTGTVTVRPANGATSFTYTASATATITYTNNQAGWTNPATTSYVPNLSPHRSLCTLGVG